MIKASLLFSLNCDFLKHSYSCINIIKHVLDTK